jgi:hypothetical protein
VRSAPHGERVKMVATVASGSESRFAPVDAYLKLLADAGLALTAAEQAAGAGELGAADEAVDRADHALDRLRADWAPIFTTSDGMMILLAEESTLPAGVAQSTWWEIPDDVTKRRTAAGCGAGPYTPDFA